MPDQTSAGSPAKQNIIYELRTYRATPGRMGDVLRRFRNHVLGFFEKYRIHSVGYWHPADDPEVLIYLLWHEDDPVPKWEALLSDPDWLAVREASIANGQIVQSVESRYLDLITDMPAISGLKFNPAASNNS